MTKVWSFSQEETIHSNLYKYVYELHWALGDLSTIGLLYRPGFYTILLFFDSDVVDIKTRQETFPSSIFCYVRGQYPNPSSIIYILSQVVEPGKKIKKNSTRIATNGKNIDRYGFFLKPVCSILVDFNFC